MEKISTLLKNQPAIEWEDYLESLQKTKIEAKNLGDDITKVLEDSIKKAKMSKEAEEKCFAELKKLRMMSPMSAESTVVRKYLEWMVALPWHKSSKVNAC